MAPGRAQRRAQARGCVTELPNRRPRRDEAWPGALSRRSTQRSLGDAVYRDDEPLVETLLERIREIDAELAKREEARAEALAAARRHVEEEREAASATQQFAVDDTATSEEPEED